LSADVLFIQHIYGQLCPLWEREMASNSKSTDKLAILADVAKAFAPQISGFSKVTVELTWTTCNTDRDVVVPNVKVDLTR
jgi:hypothetical protein